MQRRIRTVTALMFAAASLPIAACGHGNNNQQSAAGNVAPPAATQPSDTTAVPVVSPSSPGYSANPADPAASGTSAAVPDSTTTVTHRHHSAVKGALVGAAAGHFAGHHALLGAAAGALVQHERNKHEKP